ncbi:hypothetical protein GGR33_005253 [Methylobacterium brachythecii]|uniref:Uncharacterized protein n=1 Tax=Methylobacterium brachythecii TaxID=1176177 RepID=A0A7W6AN86_9HYPH|nr:hypothetical protein [Methylobacterium brachythecii]
MGVCAERTLKSGQDDIRIRESSSLPLAGREIAFGKTNQNREEGMWPFGPARAVSIEVMFGKHGDAGLKGFVSPVFIVTVAAIVLL